VPRIAAVLSASLLILGMAACRRAHGGAHGFMLDIATQRECFGDGRTVIATATGWHRARLNGDADLPIAEAALRLREVMSHRAERLVFVMADADIPWGEFLELVDHVWPAADVVSIITPQAVEHRRGLCLAFSCGNCARLRSFHAPR